MGSSVPLAGNLLQLSHFSWKIGCVFTSDKTCPREISIAGRQLDKITKGLTTLVEVLDSDDNILASCSASATTCLSRFCDLVDQFVHELDALVQRYTEIKRMTKLGGMSVARTWRPKVLEKYDEIPWTADGASLVGLRELLGVYTDCLGRCATALQSRSPVQVESTLQSLVQEIFEAHTTIRETRPANTSLLQTLLLTSSIHEGSRSPSRPPSQRSASYTSLDASTMRMTPSISPRSNSIATSYESYSYRPTFSTPTSPSIMPMIPDTPETPDLTSSNTAETSYEYSSPIQCPDGLGIGVAIDGTEPDLGRAAVADFENEKEFGTDSAHLYPSARTPSPSRPASIASSVDSEDLAERQAQVDYHSWKLTARSESGGAEMLPTEAAIKQAEFERDLVKNAMVLCELNVKSVKYTWRKHDLVADFVTKTACRNAKIMVIPNDKDAEEDSSISIWTCSRDGETRFEQILDSDVDRLPYTTWGVETNVILRVPTTVKYHSLDLAAPPVHQDTTSWLTYEFEHVKNAISFQNALFGSELLLTVKTIRTTRSVEGLSGAFSTAVQLCGLEHLRIFHHRRTGIACALIHYIPTVMDGYLSLPLNNIDEPLRLIEDGDAALKVKGLNFSLKASVKNSYGRPQVMMRRSSTLHTETVLGGGGPQRGKDTVINAVKIDFASKEDRAMFMSKVDELRRELRRASTRS